MRVAVFIFKDGEKKEAFRHMSRKVNDIDDIEPTLDDIEEFMDITFDELHDEELDEEDDL